MSSYIVAFIVVFIASFLLGSIPFGLIISRIFYKTDIRAHGSGNIGTTNAIRTMGKIGGYTVFILDFVKGVLSGIMGLWIGQLFLTLQEGAINAGSVFSVYTPLRIGTLGDSSVFLVSFVGILLAVSFCGCTFGHVFSPWLKFKGGKGIAVAVGCVFVTFGVLGACIELAIFIVLVIATRYVSVGSIAAAAVCPFFGLYFFWGNWTAVVLCAITGLTVVWAHRKNIERLRAGTESRIGSKKNV